MTSPAPPTPVSEFEDTIRQYIPEELISPTWKCLGEDFSVQLQSLLADEQSQLGMVESAERLEDDICSYFGLPRRKFEDPFKKLPYDYKNADEKPCIYKSDMYKMFNASYCCPFSNPLVPRAVKMILNVCWIFFQKGVSDNEMIVCSCGPDFSEFEMPPYTLPETPSENDLATMINEWKVKNRSDINEMVDFIVHYVDAFLETFKEKKKSIEEYTVDIKQIIEYVGFVIGKVAKFASDNDIHMPPLHAMQKKKKAVIRVFQVGNKKFVMAEELRKTCEQHNIDIGRFKKEVSGMQELSTLTYDQVANKIKGVAEIVTIEKERLQTFGQTPIRYDGGHCILSVDALYELLLDMIVVKKVFQTNEENQLEKFFLLMEFYFDVSRGVYFLSFENVEVIWTMWEYFYSHQMKKSNGKVIKKAKTAGFSVGELNETLKSLELCFEDISKYADLIYPKLATVENGLSLYQLHMAVIYCQINCFARKVPKILEFIHNQNSCNRMNIVECQHCSDEAAAKKMENLEIGGKKKNKKKK
ncbi:hypothetical protein GCK72_020775 [Caenorhabditis remanei]|uniref:Uncharacterized protein n=1 Tax=Caenorhabditis remanei TaxID=31234 RepID=A0A6A5GI33_CAERE|nr:hypothetical protein GCK72_020775 [Caenorhabditis remanei]KAF1754215.1 hypothetical protein GCK72_020775 [Caenorhabditis remanei]